MIEDEEGEEEPLVLDLRLTETLIPEAYFEKTQEKVGQR